MLPTAMEQQKFRKEERLRSKRAIDDLFRNGSSFILYPYRVVYRRLPATLSGGRASLVRILFSVPKRRFHKAVDRNLLKRRMREAYRLQKGPWLETISANSDQRKVLHPDDNSKLYGFTSLDVAVQYIASEKLDFSILHSKMADVLSKLRNEYGKVYLGEDH